MSDILEKLKQACDQVRLSSKGAGEIHIPTKYGCTECKDAVWIALRDKEAPELFCPHCNLVYDAPDIIKEFIDDFISRNAT